MKILIIEDETRIGNNIKKFFESQDINVSLVETGNDGLACVDSEDFDVLIIDWMLPDISGIEVCEKIRKSGSNVPIIMLTAKSELEDKLQGFDVGADDYITKPFLMEELLARVKSVNRRQMGEMGNIIKILYLEINLKTCEVLVKNKKIDLAPREYSLLEYLAQNKCKVLSREQIISHVWGEELDPFSNTVDVHIKYLRDKIELGSKIKIIKTVKNRGYMLCDS